MAKLEIKPIFVTLSSVIILEPFRYVWNNLPSSLGEHIGLVLSALIAGFVVIALCLSWIMTVCWKLWRPD
ncbi:MAG TPA: hypothetical protein VGR92_21430 [Steroidobacteraceae bacterium]|nr:hypothetical protein [Steroidobacteraceae bacterium]